MKKIVLAALVNCFSAYLFSQNPANSYTNGAVNTVPGNPNQRADTYTGTNPAGDPNQKDGNTIAIPDPTGQRTGSNNTYYQGNPTGAPPTQPAPNTIQPAPNVGYPSSPGVSSPTNQTHRLFQDPVKTSKYPNSDPAVGSKDGSSGKYKGNHKSVNGHKFATNKRHIKKAKKSHSDKSHQEVR